MGAGRFKDAFRHIPAQHAFSRSTKQLLEGSVFPWSLSNTAKSGFLNIVSETRCLSGHTLDQASVRRLGLAILAQVFFSLIVSSRRLARQGLLFKVYYHQIQYDFWVRDA